MTNRELIVELLNSDLDAEVDLRKTIGDLEFKPLVIGRWMGSDQHSVMCNKCGCRVSRKACSNMRYCFNCGAKMQYET